MIGNTYEISEKEFDDLTFGRYDTVFLEYNSQNGTIVEDGWLELSRDDENSIGRDFLDSFIDSGKQIAWGRNEILDINYEITRI